MSNLIIQDYKFYLITKIAILKKLIFAYTVSVETAKLCDHFYLMIHQVSIVTAMSIISNAVYTQQTQLDILHKRLLRMLCIQEHLYNR